MSWFGPEAILKNSINVFGELITHSPQAVEPYTFKAIFDNESSVIDPNSGMAVMLEKPQINVLLSDMKVVPKKGDTIAVRSKNYKIEQIKPDGQGGASIMLKLNA